MKYLLDTHVIIWMVVGATFGRPRAAGCRPYNSLR